MARHTVTPPTAFDRPVTPLKVIIPAYGIVSPVIFSTVFTVQDSPIARVVLNMACEMLLPHRGIDTRSRGKLTTVALVWLAEM